MRVPTIVGVADGAAIPEVFLTAWDALVLQGGLTSGRWALVHAGASGVGTASIQIAKSIGARIAVTCSTGKIDAVPLARCRPRARTVAVGLVDRGDRRSSRRLRHRPRCRRWRGGRAKPAGGRAEGTHHPGRVDGWQHGASQRVSADGPQGVVDRDPAARPADRGEDRARPAALHPRCCRCSTVVSCAR